jgi:parvulin-like peptidyl-prolyl isomerase
VRSFQFRLALLAILILAALSACAGGKDSSTNVSSVTQPDSVSAAEPASEAGAQAQPTEEPLAARVNGEPITLAAFQQERARRSVGLDVQPATQAAFDAQVLQSMIDQVLIDQAAAGQGIVVTDAEIDSELAAQSDIAAGNNQTLDQIVAAEGYTMDEYRGIIHDLLLTQKLSQVVADVPPVAEQVHARHILVADEATARELLAQLQQGADFAQLAVQYSLDGSTAPSGGDLDWVSRGDLLQPEVENAIFSLQPGQLSPEPVKSSLGYHIIQVLERVPDRPLSQAALAEKKQQAFLTWLDGQRQAAVIERYVGVSGQ